MSANEAEKDKKEMLRNNHKLQISRFKKIACFREGFYKFKLLS